MSTNLVALQALIKLVADAAKDTATALTSGSATLITKLTAYQNIIGDVAALIPEVGSIPAEAKALSPDDYATLAASLVTDLAITNAEVDNIINASLKLVTDIVSVIVPDVEAIIAAAHPAPASAAPVEAPAAAPAAPVSPATTSG